MTGKRYPGDGSSGAPEVAALAEAIAGNDGHTEAFLKERAIANGVFAKNGTIIGEGYYQGYLVDAEEVINRLNRMGFDVTPIRTAEVRVLK